MGKKKKGRKRKEETKRKGRAEHGGPACHPSTQEAEAERLPVRGYPGLHRASLSKPGPREQTGSGRVGQTHPEAL